MTFAENYHDWLRDAHAMEKQAEKMLTAMAERIEHYPQFQQRITQHLTETQHQLSLLEEILDRNNVSRSLIKDTFSKLEALGMSLGSKLASDEIVKLAISSYVFEQLEIASYTALIAAAKLAGDNAAIPVFESILKQEVAMAEWALVHLPDVSEQFLQRAAAPGAEAKK